MFLELSDVDAYAVQNVKKSQGGSIGMGFVQMCYLSHVPILYHFVVGHVTFVGQILFEVNKTPANGVSSVN